MMAGESGFRFRPGLTPTLFLLTVVPVLIGLGLWQLQRADWKAELVARIEAQLDAPPQPVSTIDDLPREEFLRVRLEGRFGGEAMFLGGRTLGGRAGWHVVTPFELTDGGWVIVDRGWIPMTARSHAVPLGGEGPIEGVVRLPPEAGTFTPEDDPGAGEWYRIDPMAMASASGIEKARVAPVYVAASGSTSGNEGDGKPIPTGDRFVLPQNHFQYAMTWFGLAATLAAVYLVYGFRRPGSTGDR